MASRKSGFSDWFVRQCVFYVRRVEHGRGFWVYLTSNNLKRFGWWSLFGGWWWLSLRGRAEGVKVCEGLQTARRRACFHFTSYHCSVWVCVSVFGLGTCACVYVHVNLEDLGMWVWGCCMSDSVCVCLCVCARVFRVVLVWMVVLTKYISVHSPSSIQSCSSDWMLIADLGYQGQKNQLLPLSEDPVLHLKADWAGRK